ncbi:hypothetical protein KSS87_014599 [Heliosperma pusillum]|nr:hypothetical protein KSS87_014599 [Heliosperma pusillum]
MASFTKLVCFFFLLTTLQTYARDSNFFSQVTRNRDYNANPNLNYNNNNQENQATPFSKQGEEQQPTFVPQTTQGGYGLYGHETGLDAPTTTTTTTATTANPSKLYNMDDNQYDNQNNNKNENFESNQEGEPDFEQLSETSYMNNNNNNNNINNDNINNNVVPRRYVGGNNNNNNNNNKFLESNQEREPEFEELSETSYTDNNNNNNNNNNNDNINNYNNNNNNNNNKNGHGKYYGGVGYNGGVEKQGMSDTRLNNDDEDLNRETGMGWPLGLGSMYMRLRMVERRSSLYAQSTSFSSFSSSNLDTESTVSFFQDKSKSLGRLIGIRPRDRRPETMYVQISADEGSEVTGGAKLLCRVVDAVSHCNSNCIAYIHAFRLTSPLWLDS